mmetsp:Transcript_33560/g.81126  ORF Transcript_33560/g.81126 Transcript_33560/m.81126 type:complete len:275 (-) Transcript_33560:56-880(-)
MLKARQSPGHNLRRHAPFLDDRSVGRDPPDPKPGRDELTHAVQAHHPPVLIDGEKTVQGHHAWHVVRALGTGVVTLEIHEAVRIILEDGKIVSPCDFVDLSHPLRVHRAPGRVLPMRDHVNHPWLARQIAFQDVLQALWDHAFVVHLYPDRVAVVGTTSRQNTRVGEFVRHHYIPGVAQQHHSLVHPVRVPRRQPHIPALPSTLGIVELLHELLHPRPQPGFTTAVSDPVVRQRGSQRLNGRREGLEHRAATTQADATWGVHHLHHDLSNWVLA